MSRQLLGGQGRVAAETLGLARLTKPQPRLLRGAKLAEAGGYWREIIDFPIALMMKLDPNIRYIGVRSGPAGYGGDLLSRLI